MFVCNVIYITCTDAQYIQNRIRLPFDARKLFLREFDFMYSRNYCFECFETSYMMYSRNYF